MQLDSDEPKSLKDPITRKRRLAAIREKHVSPLTDFVESIRRDRRMADEVPHFDPADGGCAASCLFLLEAPGPKAITSGFVSRNNPDESAKNFFLLNQEARLDRRLTVTWNIVPWYIGSGHKIRPATGSDIAAGLPYLGALLSLLPSLRIVILIGRKAQRARAAVRDMAPGATILDMLHPSPLVVNHDPRNRPKMLETLKTARKLLDQEPEFTDA